VKLHKGKQNRYRNPVIDTAAVESVKAWQCT